MNDNSNNNIQSNSTDTTSNMNNTTIGEQIVTVGSAQTKKSFAGLIIGIVSVVVVSSVIAFLFLNKNNNKGDNDNNGNNVYNELSVSAEKYYKDLFIDKSLLAKNEYTIEDINSMSFRLRVSELYNFSFKNNSNVKFVAFYDTSYNSYNMPYSVGQININDDNIELKNVVVSVFGNINKLEDVKSLSLVSSYKLSNETSETLFYIDDSDKYHTYYMYFIIFDNHIWLFKYTKRKLPNYNKFTSNEEEYTVKARLYTNEQVLNTIKKGITAFSHENKEPFLFDIARLLKIPYGKYNLTDINHVYYNGFSFYTNSYEKKGQENIYYSGRIYYDIQDDFVKRVSNNPKISFVTTSNDKYRIYDNNNIYDVTVSSRDEIGCNDVNCIYQAIDMLDYVEGDTLKETNIDTKIYSINDTDNKYIKEGINTNSNDVLFYVDDISTFSQPYKICFTGSVKKGVIKTGDKLYSLGINKNIEEIIVTSLEQFRKNIDSISVNERASVCINNDKFLREDFSQGQVLINRNSLIAVNKFNGEIVNNSSKDIDLSEINDVKTVIKINDIINMNAQVYFDSNIKVLKPNEKLKITFMTDKTVPIIDGTKFKIVTSNNNYINGNITKFYESDK